MLLVQETHFGQQGSIRNDVVSEIGHFNFLGGLLR